MSEAAVSGHKPQRPLRAAEFDDLMQACGPFPAQPRFAIAVSGGPDSITLLYMLHDWVLQRGGVLHAITIDHQLRDESAAEASQVKQWCADKSITHTTLVWKKDHAPKSAVHQQARIVRYELLCNECKQHNIDNLFIGQHADDQAETVLMRFIKGSGIDGLAGMPKTRSFDGVKIVRPLLPITKQRVMDTCEQHKWAFFIDPSNDSSAYLRGRLRKAAAPLANEGLTSTNLFEMGRSAGMARAALESATNQWLQQHAITHPLGIIHLEHNVWRQLDNEQQRRTLMRILLCISGEDYAPKVASVDYLIQSLHTYETLHQTLSGCHIMVQFGIIKFFRELAGVTDKRQAHNNMNWDNRFRIILHPSLLNKDLAIAPLGDISRDTLEKMGHKQVADCAALHRATLPALYVDNQLHSVPDFCSDVASLETSQALVKAIFLPKRMLLIDSFDVCPPLLP